MKFLTSNKFDLEHIIQLITVIPAGYALEKPHRAWSDTTSQSCLDLKVT